MHGHADILEFWQDISGFLGCYYLAAAVLNVLAAVHLWRTGTGLRLFRVGRLTATSAHLWLLIGIGFGLLAPLAWTGQPQWMQWVSLPRGLRDFLDRLLSPTWFLVGLMSLLAVLFAARRFFVKPSIAWAGLNLALLAMGLSLTDPDFAAIVTKPDNVPIVAMVFLLGFFTWLSAHRAVQNDARLAHGEPPLEALESDKVLVWPDLVYIELICMVALTAVLIFWAIGLQAPLEDPANPMKTPNPSKAPWYFVGLQELLVYYDPWLAGVVLPSLIIFGLCAIPYLDRNPAGNGYYTIAQRKFAYVVFQFGFLVLWVTPIVLGTFFRGPKWAFFGPFEAWDAHKTESLYNVSLAQYFWVHWLGIGRPMAGADAGLGSRLLYILFREAPGIILLGLYFAVLPLVLARWSRLFRGLLQSLGRVRYLLVLGLLLLMALLPIKMFARWTVNLTYFISIPEYFLNF
jgi:hypothetical protein